MCNIQQCGVMNMQRSQKVHVYLRKPTFAVLTNSPSTYAEDQDGDHGDAAGQQHSEHRDNWVHFWSWNLKKKKSREALNTLFMCIYFSCHLEQY